MNCVSVLLLFFVCLLFVFFNYLYCLSLYCRLLAAVQHSLLGSFWLQSGERSAEAVRTTVFSKSTFILSYYDVVVSPWKLQGIFSSSCRTHWRCCSTSCLRSRDFKELLFVCAALWIHGCGGCEREKSTPRLSRKVFKPLSLMS